MGIRNQILLSVGAIFLVLVSLLYAFSRTILLDSYRSIEAENAEQDVQRVLNAIQTDTDNLLAIVGDWSAWDDTYAFMKGEDAEYIDSNLSVSTLSNLSLIHI